MHEFERGCPFLPHDITLSEGWRAVTHVTLVRYGAEPAIDFVRQLRPDVVVYTVSVPYREGWEKSEALRVTKPGCAFLLTTTNKQALDEIIGPNGPIEIIAAVRRALDARRHGGTRR